ncbi:hypothetical protein LSTR_LSTR010384 [Laodelphax striatellus]|uniref:Uncharacterized protein n=1 Tax=Laodelphax striatellus TaxID=195883 RepID=A0A482XI86_LAOST|nr:hypothetical protein LSTR_LSTR010384 [Laodelphax striatellus]
MLSRLVDEYTVIENCYCDVFFKCRAVDAEGPLARLKNTLFNKETLLTVTQWVTEYWWACLLRASRSSLSWHFHQVLCCAHSLPNPKKPPRASFNCILLIEIICLKVFGDAASPDAHTAPYGALERWWGRAEGRGDGVDAPDPVGRDPHTATARAGANTMCPKGYCDVFFKCRAVDAEGPLARLKNTLFNKETLLTVTQWVTEYWWACLLMGIAFIIVMGIFIKCCAVHTPSSNPKKPPARRFSETLRHPMHTLRRMGRSSGGGGGGRGGVVMGGSTRPGPSRPGPAHGYGEGRGQYYVPKATAPPANRPDLYAGAYTDRNAFHMRQHKV